MLESSFRKRHPFHLRKWNDPPRTYVSDNSGLTSTQPSRTIFCKIFVIRESGISIKRCYEMRRKIAYLKQKVTLYFDENMPLTVLEHFRTNSYWRKKIRVVGAADEGNTRSDEFQFNYCSRKGYILVSLDYDFVDDKKYPFANGKLHGLIVVKASRQQIQRIVNGLARFLNFLLRFPLPKDLCMETKFVCSEEGVVMRGRVIGTKQVSNLYLTRGTTQYHVRKHFNYMLPRKRTILSLEN
jgi:predicted nuclease of predicted toxin-antitoxin system